jgi:hypothetical protein
MSAIGMALLVRTGQIAKNKYDIGYFYKPVN